MVFVLLLAAASAFGASVAVHTDLRGSSPGALDGLAADLRLMPASRLSVQVGGSARLSNTSWDRSQEDDWLRASELGTLDDGVWPIAADVWTAEALVGFRALEGALPVDVQAGWALRGQAAAYLLQDAGSFTVRTDQWDGQVRLEPINPLVGVGVGLQATPGVALDVAIQQVFPIQDAVVDANPGFTVVRVGARFGKGPAVDTSAPDDGPPGIRVLGVEEADAVFAQVDAILKELDALEGALADARAGLARVAQLQGMAPADYLAEVRAGGIDLGLSVTLQGGRPQVTVRPGLQGELGEAAAAVESIGQAAGQVVEAVPTLVKQTEALVTAARELVEAGPQLVKGAGISPLKVPEVVGDLRHNMDVTASLPQRLGAVLSEATELMAAMGAT